MSETRTLVSIYLDKYIKQIVLTIGFIATLDGDLKAGSAAGVGTIYSASKFVQLLGAHYWRRNLPECTVVAVSPGLIPSTNLATNMGLSMNMPDAKTVPEGKNLSSSNRSVYLRHENNVCAGAENLLRAFTVNDFPTDPEQIFLTSWGEWWPKDVYALSLDTKLQDKWCLSLEEIEKEEGLSNQ